MTETRGRRALRWFNVLFGLLGIYFAWSYFVMAQGAGPPVPPALKGTLWLVMSALFAGPELIRWIRRRRDLE